MAGGIIILRFKQIPYHTAELTPVLGCLATHVLSHAVLHHAVPSQPVLCAVSHYMCRAVFCALLYYATYNTDISYAVQCSIRMVFTCMYDHALSQL